ELFRQNPKAALQRPVRATAGALLQLIGEPPDHQIATEAQGRSGVIQCKPSTPQLLCRSVDQPGSLTKFKLVSVRILQSVLPAVVWTETGRRLASVLAGRSIVDWSFHRRAGSAIR